MSVVTNFRWDVLLSIGLSILVIALRLAALFAGRNKRWIPAGLGLGAILIGWIFEQPVIVSSVGMPVFILGVFMLVQDKIQDEMKKGKDVKNDVKKLIFWLTLLGLGCVFAYAGVILARIGKSFGVWYYVIWGTLVVLFFIALFVMFRRKKEGSKTSSP